MSKFILLVCVALSFSACSSGKYTPEKQQKLTKLHYQMGIDALNKGLLPKAFKELLEADKIQPGQAKVEDALAYAWRVRGDLDKSERYYKKALAHESRASTQNNYASLLIQMKKYKQAEKLLRQALEDPRYPNQDLVFMNLGDAMLGQGLFNDAIDAYRKAQRFRPNQILPKMKEAAAYIRFNRLNYARALYETLLRKNEGNRLIAEGLLSVLKKQNDLPAARAMLKTYRHQSSNDLDKAWAEDELAGIR